PNLGSDRSWRVSTQAGFVISGRSAAEIVAAGRHGTKVLLRMRNISALIGTYFSNHPMKLLKILALSVALLTTVQAVQQPSAHTKGTPTGKPTGQLKPGEYWWKPQLSPSGPLMVLVSVPEQTMHVYRN